ncbi:carbohydrate ABC transporter permease [Jiangella endophytica]|uniref:carbohydrate ABC transporter permease n=1 Tax=Jiangella endophytica TaxID=1623398 RepID=UPI000E34EDEC|nr:carbohydrate ABC transporter permease [Jiangella endophytica]
MTMTLDKATGSAPAAPAPARRRHTGRDRTHHLRITLPLVVFLVLTLVPFYWMILYAFRPRGSNSLLPVPFTLDNFVYVWNTVGYDVYFRNSVIVALISMALTTVVSVAGGYAIARYRFAGRPALMVALLCTQFIPGAMLLIPLYSIFNSLGLVNNLWSLIIANVVFELPLTVILMSSFIQKIPFELEEAAMVDGCSRLRGFLAVILPQLRPALVAIGSFTFIGAWNSFLFALMFLSTQELFTIPVGLSYTVGEDSINYGVMAAGGLVAAVPVVVIFGFIQKFLVQGISGAVKG